MIALGAEATPVRTLALASTAPSAKPTHPFVEIENVSTGLPRKVKGKPIGIPLARSSSAFENMIAAGGPLVGRTESGRYGTGHAYWRCAWARASPAVAVVAA